MQIKITGDLSEMIQIARAIVIEKADYYSYEVMEGLRQEILHHVNSSQIGGE